MNDHQHHPVKLSDSHLAPTTWSWRFEPAQTCHSSLFEANIEVGWTPELAVAVAAMAVVVVVRTDHQPRPHQGRYDEGSLWWVQEGVGRGEREVAHQLPEIRAYLERQNRSKESGWGLVLGLRKRWKWQVAPD